MRSGGSGCGCWRNGEGRRSDRLDGGDGGAVCLRQRRVSLWPRPDCPRGAILGFGAEGYAWCLGARRGTGGRRGAASRSAQGTSPLENPLLRAVRCGSWGEECPSAAVSRGAGDGEALPCAPLKGLRPLRIPFCARCDCGIWGGVARARLHPGGGRAAGMRAVSIDYDRIFWRV